MAYIIDTEKCINCGLCDPECPVDAIIEESDNRDIIAESCIDCGACVSVCPAKCISPN